MGMDELTFGSNLLQALRSMARVNGKCKISWDVEWELEDLKLVLIEWSFGYGACGSCKYEPFRGWREAWKMVNIVRRN